MQDTRPPLFIEEMYIRGFKSIKEVTVQLRPINIIIGANGSGKSNLLSVFDFIRHYKSRKIRLYGDANDVFHFGAKYTKEMEIGMKSKEFSCETTFTVSANSDKIQMKHETSLFPSEQPDEYITEKLKSIKVYHFHDTSPHATVRSTHNIWDNIQLHPDGSNLASVLHKIKSYGNNPDKYKKNQSTFLDRYNILHRKLKAVEKETEELNKAINELRNALKEFGKDSSNAPDILENLDNLFEERWKSRRTESNIRRRIRDLTGDRYPAHQDSILDDDIKLYIQSYNEIIRSIKSVAPYFNDFVLQQDDNKVRLQWQNIHSLDKVFDSSQLSDGTLRFILLTTLLLQPHPHKIIVLDEPELGLHPKALIVLANMIRNVSKKTQIILTTQSVEFANMFDPEDFIVADYKNGESSFKRYTSEDLKQWLEDDYGMGDIWNTNFIGGRP